MLMQPTIEKLYSMKLTGMAEAIRRQMESTVRARSMMERSIFVGQVHSKSARGLKPPIREC